MCAGLWCAKKDENSPAPTADVPELPKRVEPSHFAESTPEINVAEYNNDLAGAPYRWGDYEVGEKIDHVDGMTIEEAEHQMATRLYQNTAKVHFNNHTESQGRFGKRLMYGGHVISMARALSFNGLANGFHVAAINGGRHVSPCFAGDTIYAWSEILEKEAIPGREDVGALRVKTIAVKNHTCADFPGKTEDGYHESVMLDLDYWLVMPR
jgi:2-methylfumaryl-CoA hydratase